MRQRLPDRSRRLDEGDAIAVVLLDAGGDSEDVRVEDDVFGREADLLRQEFVGSAADRDLPLERVGLAFLVEGHHHHGRAVVTHEFRDLQKGFLALLHRDRVDDRLALHALQAGLDHLELRAIDHHRHAGDVRLGGDEVQVVDHRLLRVDQALVHVDVDDLRAVLDLLARHRQRRWIVAAGDQLAKSRRARNVGALADVDERDFRREHEGLEAAEPHLRRHRRRAARRLASHGFRDGANVVRRRAAAAADDVDQPLVGEAGDLPRHRLRRLVVLAELVRQAGVRVGADQRVGDIRDFGQVIAHRGGPERAIQADRERVGVAHRMPEGGRRLAGQSAAGSVGDGAGDHDRQVDLLLGEHLPGREDRGLGVQRVEDRLDQDEVGAAVDQTAHLFGVGGAKFVEGRRAEAGIVDVRRDRGRAVGRPERAGHEAAAAVLPFGADAGAPHQPRAVAIELVDLILHRVVGLRDRGGGEGVGLDDVRAGDGVGVMDVLDRLRLGEDQEVVVAFQVALAAPKAVAPEVLLVEPKPLDLRAHRTVEDQDACRSGREQRVARARPVGPGGVSEEAVADGAHRLLSVRHRVRHKDIRISLYGGAASPQVCYSDGSSRRRLER